MKKSFTLMELLIVIALLVLVAIIVLVALNPWAQIAKAQDSKRKTELTQLNKALEDYYNDKGCYPKPSEICYDLPPTNICTGAGSHGPLVSQKCHICGNESMSPLFSPYLSRLPCDPQHKQKQYLYEVSAKSGLQCDTVEDPTNTCPQWYRVYSNLSSQSDSSSKDLGCQGGGCGIAPNYGYDFGITSPNETLQKTTSYYCFNTSSRCNSCGATYEICESKPSCLTIYSSNQSCCLRLPKPSGC